ncbi:hypothetical protein K8S19_12920 [bacterium]|nr:hypothetical protein [bacterium]
MRLFLTIYLFALCVLMGFSSLQAAVPAADVAPMIKKDRPTKPADQLQADFRPESLKLPPKPWRIPQAPLDMRGRGVSLFYLIPYKRVQSILPTKIKPYPGGGKTWFRVDVIEWTIIRSRLNPAKKMKKFVEMTYRFEVMQAGQRASYVLKMYADTGWPVLWSRKYGEYNAFPANKANVNFSPYIHFFQLVRKKNTVAVVHAEPREGVSAQMNDLFGKRKNIELWSGSERDITAWYSDDSLVIVDRRFETEIKNAEVKSLLLPEPIQWKILSEDEVMQPDKVFIMENITGYWSESAK